MNEFWLWVREIFATILFFGLIALLYVVAVMLTGGDPKYW